MAGKRKKDIDPELAAIRFMELSDELSKASRSPHLPPQLQQFARALAREYDAESQILMAKAQ